MGASSPSTTARCRRARLRSRRSPWASRRSCSDGRLAVAAFDARLVARRVALMQGDIPAETVVKALAVGVWLIWLQVVWALAWECVVNVPRVGTGRRPRSAPLVAAPVGNGVGRLVALVLSIGLTIASVPATAIALPSAPIAGLPAAGPTSSFAVVGAAERPAEPAVAAPRWKVDKQDSLWRIAETALGEGDRSNEILELNSWLRSARDLRAGHVLVLPTDAAVPDDRQPPVDAAPVESPEAASGAITYLAPTHIVIEQGDTLWDLSEERLSIVGPRRHAARDARSCQRGDRREPRRGRGPEPDLPGRSVRVPGSRHPAGTRGTPRSTPALPLTTAKYAMHSLRRRQPRILNSRPNLRPPPPSPPRQRRLPSRRHRWSRVRREIHRSLTRCTAHDLSLRGLLGSAAPRHWHRACC